MPNPAILFTVHVAATLFMTGLIWFVQIVHYPLFASVGREGFARYEIEHSRRTTWVVAPAMLAELASGLLLLAVPMPVSVRGALVSTLAILSLIWLSTALVQVPRHRVLTRGYDETARRTLVSTNWLRTAGWSIRAVILLSATSDFMRNAWEVS